MRRLFLGLVCSLNACDGASRAIPDGPGPDAPLPDARGGCGCSGAGLRIHVVLVGRSECSFVYGLREVDVTVNGHAYFPEESPGNGLLCAIAGDDEEYFELSWPADVVDGAPVVVSFSYSGDQQHAEGSTVVIASRARCQDAELVATCELRADAGVSDAR